MNPSVKMHPSLLTLPNSAKALLLWNVQTGCGVETHPPPPGPVPEPSTVLAWKSVRAPITNSAITAEAVATESPPAPQRRFASERIVRGDIVGAPFRGIPCVRSQPTLAQALACRGWSYAHSERAPLTRPVRSSHTLRSGFTRRGTCADFARYALDRCDGSMLVQRVLCNDVQERTWLCLRALPHQRARSHAP